MTTNLNKLIWLVEIGHLSRAQDVVDVFQEGFIYNLSVVEQKHCWLIVYSGQPIQLLDVWKRTETSAAAGRDSCSRKGNSVFDPTFSKLLFAVMLGDFHLINLVSTNEGAHFGKALSARATNTHQEHVTSELADHAHCARHCRGNTRSFNKSIYSYILYFLVD